MTQGLGGSGGWAMFEGVEIAIVSGVLTVTQSVVIVASESGTSDSLDTIVYADEFARTGYTTPLYLFAKSGHTITLEHETPTTGNISLASGSDFSLTGKKVKGLIRVDSAGFFVDF